MFRANFLFLLAILSFSKSCAPKSVNSKTAALENESLLIFMIKSDYCGGAPLSDEMLKDYRKEKPAINESITLISTEGKSKKIELTTNNSGSASHNVKPGTYNIYLSEKLNTKANKDSDKICLKWIKKQNGVLTISDNEKEVSITLQRTCNPCKEVSY